MIIIMNNNNNDDDDYYYHINVALYNFYHKVTKGYGYRYMK